MPDVVFDRTADLERRLAEAEAKLERQRKLKNERQQRWRDSHREHVREYDRNRYARKSSQKSQ